MKNKVLVSFISLAMAGLLAVSCAGCGENKTDNTSEAQTTAATTAAAESETKNIDYMAIVNKTHKLPDDWEMNLKTVRMMNSIKDSVEVEAKAYDAYKKLKKDLKKDGIKVDLDSARRSVSEQQRIMDDFTKKYGKDYALKTVAQPGYSEHHTGLALDLYLIKNGKDITENEDMIKYTGTWAKIHKKLAKYGFILRYLKDKEHITGYGYEPWHIRYIDNADAAKLIMSKGITFEEYRGIASGNKVKIDYATSAIYSQDELKDAVIQVKCKFAAWDGCELKSITYAGDSEVNDENLKKLNKENPDGKYTKIAKFLMDFKTPKDNKNEDLKADKNYKDYEWWLAKTKEGWEIVSYGEK